MTLLRNAHKKLFISGLITLAGCATLPISPAPLPAAIAMQREIARAEAAFMAETRRIGLMSAFAARADDSAIMFLPDPILIKPRLATERWPGEISWSPEFIVVSRDGTLGASIGPSSWRIGNRANPGYYFTVWKRSNGPDLRFVFDAGTDMPRDLYAGRTGAIEHAVSSPSPGRTSDLRAAEKRLGIAARAGDTAGYGRLLHAQARILRDGYEPVVGTSDIRLLRAEAATHAVLGLRTSADGTLAWSYGSITPNGKTAPAAHFARVWSLAGREWKIIVDYRKEK